MSCRTESESATEKLVGFALHAVLGTLGSLLLGSVISLGIDAIASGRDRQVKFLPFIVASALLASFATSRWFSRSAPWVGLLGLAALCLGVQELAREWSPSWSHQTRGNYVLSQLFCVGSGCGDSEGLYALLSGWPFACLTTYSLVALITLRLTRKSRVSV